MGSRYPTIGGGPRKINREAHSLSLCRPASSWRRISTTAELTDILGSHDSITKNEVEIGPVTSAIAANSHILEHDSGAGRTCAADGMQRGASEACSADTASCPGRTRRRTSPRTRFSLCRLSVRTVGTVNSGGKRPGDTSQAQPCSVFLRQLLARLPQCAIDVVPWPSAHHAHPPALELSPEHPSCTGGCVDTERRLRRPSCRESVMVSVSVPSLMVSRQDAR
ncbi:hypothetical protein B0H67DRAFT_584624 [Lasiosphaeris hirsuta]|uniref:Uncharacterized protein n=1 Tax=Lasiosphaeris hirsuta TaxID=260670 RepID=A0AA40A8E3_9PEZI|nr:hypothetical protein B0H67DRAFT_584624 [Lasiosphaeris hirsuta]